jgi:pimeloyl-ACP methyl ester carboxylesterase
MYSARTLQITGYRDEPVPNTFLRQNGDADHVAILLPGVRYTCDMPLLYYPAGLLLDLGADVLRVEHARDRRADFQAITEAEQGRWFLADAAAACHTVLAQRDYQHVTLIGKSIGTLAMGHLLTTDPALAQARAIWLTPLLTHGGLRAQIKQCRQRSLFVIGTADRFYDKDKLAEVQAASHGAAVVIEGADHSLEIAGDVFQSLQSIERVIRAIQSFLA